VEHSINGARQQLKELWEKWIEKTYGGPESLAEAMVLRQRHPKIQMMTLALMEGANLKLQGQRLQGQRLQGQWLQWSHQLLLRQLLRRRLT
jgi:hypothetical protein